MRLSYPELGAYLDWAVLALRFMVALVFFTSGSAHLRHPHQRASSLGLSVPLTVFIGLAEVLGSLGLLFGVLTQWAALGLILIMLGAVFMKVVKWKTGFWGEKNSGWHYELLFITMSLVIIATNGGRLVLLQ
jgi:putative oxidoreductase